LDLFTGIGGFTLAAEWVWGVEHEIVAFCEQDKFCQDLLIKHWPGVLIYDDIFKLNGNEIKTKNVDLLTGGFPCQPFSVAGKQKGKGDDRYLWPEMSRIIEESVPTWVVIENVDGIVNMAESTPLPDLENAEHALLEEGEVRIVEGPGYLEEILVEIEAMGYEVQPYIVPACGVDAPHLRFRAWVVAHSERNGQSASKIPLGPKETIREQPPRQSGTFDAEGAGGLSETERPLADTNKQHGNDRGPGTSKISQLKPSGIFTGEWWAAEPRVGDMVDGLSPWMAEPAGVPRTATGVKDSTNKLKALGNAIVPQVAYEFLRFIKEAEDMAVDG
jgi:DNA (cytosine-5)-methyltransferase 1